MTRQLPQTPFHGSIIMQCRVSCADGSYTGENQQVLGLALVYQWIDGSDRRVVESFVGHVNHKVTDAGAMAVKDSTP
jgi:hypothetical protein